MIAIIPARGGSKGLPNKNIKRFCGIPLISHTIRTAKKSGSVTRLIVSTDSEEIADIARQEGAEVPFMRPDYLATDDALALDTYIYTSDRLMQSEGLEIDSFMVLQPTSPLRTKDDIDAAVAIYTQSNADSLISVCEAPYPMEWLRYIDNLGVLREYNTNSIQYIKNRQDYKKSYVPNGAIFIFKYQFLKVTRNYYSNNTYPYVMAREKSIDIDNPIDFLFAEFLYQAQLDNNMIHNS